MATVELSLACLEPSALGRPRSSFLRERAIAFDFRLRVLLKAFSFPTQLTVSIIASSSLDVATAHLQASGPVGESDLLAIEVIAG